MITQRALLLFCLALCCALPALPATLALPVADIAIAPGATGGWGVDLTGDPLYWLVVDSVQSTFIQYPGGLSATPPPADPLSSFLAGLKLAPGGSFVQAWAPGLGLGSFTMRADAVLGAYEAATVTLYYSLFEGDPDQGGVQVFPELDPGFVEARAGVTAAAVPEPTSVIQLGAGLAAFLLAARIGVRARIQRGPFGSR